MKNDHFLPSRSLEKSDIKLFHRHPSSGGNPTCKCLFVSVIYLLIFHPLLFLFGWAYWQTIFTNPGHPTSEVSHKESSDSFDMQSQKKNLLQLLIASLIQINTNASNTGTIKSPTMSFWREDFRYYFLCSLTWPLERNVRLWIRHDRNIVLNKQIVGKRKKYIFLC